MINRYIKELLNEHNRVIVPDLGAFLYKGESSRTIYFNEFLRFNDGLLLNYIAEQGKMDKIEAAKQIKAYVEETNKRLQAKKKIAIEGVGYLFLDENDKIQLQPDINQEHQTEESQSKSSFIIEETKVPETIEPVFIPEKPTDETNSEISTPASFDFTETKRAQSFQEVKAENAKPAFKTSSPTQVKSSPSASRKKNTAPPAKSNRTILWIASIAVIIIISLLYLFIIKPLYISNTSDKKAAISNADLDTIVTTNSVADSANDNIQPTTEENPAMPIVTSRHKYHLVIGCFAQENNADKLVQKLKNEGFSAEKFAKIEQMYFVSIASFDSKASAEKYLRELKFKGYKDIWIKYY